MSGDAAAQFNIHEAKTNLSRIIERVEQGEEITISRAGTPVAKVIPLTSAVTRRGRGSLRGTLVATEDWDSEEVKDRLDHEPGVYVSAATVWEVSIKQAIGKLREPADLPERIRGSGFSE